MSKIPFSPDWISCQYLQPQSFLVGFKVISRFRANVKQVWKVVGKSVSWLFTTTHLTCFTESWCRNDRGLQENYHSLKYWRKNYQNGSGTGTKSKIRDYGNCKGRLVTDWLLLLNGSQSFHKRLQALSTNNGGLLRLTQSWKRGKEQMIIFKRIPDVENICWRRWKENYLQGLNWSKNCSHCLSLAVWRADTSSNVTQ